MKSVKKEIKVLFTTEKENNKILIVVIKAKD